MWVSSLIALYLLTLACSTEEKKLSNHASSLADTSSNLAFNLYHNLAKEKDQENILMSPVVVASTLGLVALGSKSSTASQVKSVLKADTLKDEHLHTGLSELLQEVSDPVTRNITWKISNKLYGPSSVSFADDFVKSSKKHYKYEHSKVNFRDKRSAITSINEWAAKSTDGKLPEVTKDVKNTDGAMIVNAMFFKPHWNEKFHHKMVDNRAFLVSRSYTISVPMMHRTGLRNSHANPLFFTVKTCMVLTIRAGMILHVFNNLTRICVSAGLYGFYDDTENRLFVLNMPLAHKKSSVIFIMPYHVEPLERLEKLLTRKQLDTWTSKLEERAVAISLPKVSMEVSHDLQKHLGALGLTEAVDKSKADLSNMSGKKDLYLSSVFHASAWEWDTEGNPFDANIFGTEKLKNPKLFYADHPFIFLVKDNQTNSILFIGRLVKPKGEKMRDEL